MGNKYHNKKTLCLSKHVHDSRFEASYCDRLLAMKRAGIILDFEIQVPFEFVVNDRLVCVHIVDFTVEDKESGVTIHEVKGVETGVWKIKRNLFKALYPNIKYVVIKKEDGSWKTKHRSRRLLWAIRMAREKKSPSIR